MKTHREEKRDYRTYRNENQDTRPFKGTEVKSNEV